MGLTRSDSFFLLAVVGLVGACRRAPPPPAEVVPLEVEWAGCAAVTRAPVDGGPEAPVCELEGERALRLYVPAPATATEVRAGDERVAGTEDDAPGGRAITVKVPTGARAVTVSARLGDRPARFTLAVGEARRPPWLDEARALRARGEASRAAELAAAHAEAPDPTERALARGLLGRLALARGRADEAFPLLRDAIATHAEAGRVSDRVDDTFALAFALHQRSHRYGEARAAMDAIASDLALYPEGRAREPYYRGILASETGDRRAALALLREAEARARKLGMRRLARNATAALALEMQALGRARASLDVLAPLERAPDAAPCERVEIANDLGWGAILANEAAGARVADARGPLERAVAVQGCEDAYLRSFALGNLARLALDEGDAAAAARRLAEAREAVREPRGTERMAWLDLEARVLLARGQREAALRRFDEALALSRAAVLLEPEWAALVGKAEALEALGRRDAAIAALLAAEEVVEAATLVVPLGEGRGAFVADRGRSARAAVDLLVRAGRVAEASRVARRSHGRVLGSIDRALRIEGLSPAERATWEGAVRSFRAAREALDAEAAADWSLPADRLARVTAERKEREGALRGALDAAMAVLSRGAPAAREADAPPGPDDLELIVHPVRGGAWIAFAEDRAVTAHSLPEPGAPPDALARALLDPVAARVAAARRVRVRAYGAYRAVDVHALPFRDRPLVATVAVDYPLGLRARPTEARPSAVVVGDPAGDLPSAVAEARSVAAALGGARLLVQSEATSRAVTSALAAAGHFHYAGHGVFAGIEGIESALPLAEGGRLTIGDVLALSPAPRTVVLSGCDAARSEGEGLGLAQAFVAAGSEEVLAPVRPVADALAASLARELYGAPDAAPQPLADRLRAAQVRLSGEQPDLDWSAFRVLAR